MDRNRQNLLQMSSKAYKKCSKDVWLLDMMSQGASRSSSKSNLFAECKSIVRWKLSGSTNEHHQSRLLDISSKVAYPIYLPACFFLLVKGLKYHKLCCSSNRLQLFFYGRQSVQAKCRYTEKEHDSTIHHTWTPQNLGLKLFLEVAYFKFTLGLWQSDFLISPAEENFWDLFNAKNYGKLGWSLKFSRSIPA